MKELIKRYQEGGDIKEELTYLIPFVGTKKLWDRWKQDKSFENGIDLALSGVADLTIPLAIGGGIKALSMGPKIARIVKAADKTAAVGQRFAKGAKQAKAVRNTKRADRLSRGARAAAKKADDLRFQAENLRGAQGVYKLQTLLPVSGATYKHMIYERNKPSNYVEKNNTKIYNTFQKKDGGIMKKLMPKHQQGGTFRKRSQGILDYFRDNILPYMEYHATRNRTGETHPNYTWTGKPIREFDDSGNAALYNPYMSTVVPVRNEKGQNGFLHYTPYFFDEAADTNSPNYVGKYTEQFYPEDGGEYGESGIEAYKNLKDTYNSLMKNGWNSREYFYNNEYGPNPFFIYRKQGGRINLIPKHQYGNSVSMQNPEESVNLRFGQEYFTFPSNALNEQQREFINKYNDKKYRGMFVSDEDEYNFYKDWEQNFGTYEPSNSTYGGYYVDDSGNVKRAKYNNNQWSVDTTKYKVYTTPLNYSKDNGYYFKVGDNVYKGGRYR